MGAATVMVRLDTLPQDVVEKILAAAESPNLHTIKNADKGKFLHVNESSGKLEYAEGGSGGGVLIVNGTFTENRTTLDKTWTEINDAPVAFVSFDYDSGERSVSPICTIGTITDIVTGTITAYFVGVVMYGDSMGDAFIARFTSETEDGVLTYVAE